MNASEMSTHTEESHPSAGSDPPASYASLRKLSLEELYGRYEQTVANGGDTLEVMLWLNEISQRAQTDSTAAMLGATKTMKNLTVLIAILTAANVAVAVLLLVLR